MSNHPIKEQCKCGSRDLEVVENATHNQYKCSKCKRVYVMTVRKQKGESQ